MRGGRLESRGRAHLTAASRLLPDDAELHRRLGERQYRGAWKTEAEIAADQGEARAQSEADDRWAPKLAAWRDALANPARRPGAVKALGEVRDPRAVPSIRWTFGDEEAWEQAWAVQLLGRIDSPTSAQELAKLAVFGLDDPVRTTALDRLAGRDPRTFIGLLINWLREPIRFQAEGPGTDGEPAVLRVEGDRSIVERVYEPFLVEASGRRKREDVGSGPFKTGLTIGKDLRPSDKRAGGGDRSRVPRRPDPPEDECLDQADEFQGRARPRPSHRGGARPGAAGLDDLVDQRAWLCLSESC